MGASNMDTLYKLMAFLGFIAFVQGCSLASKVSRMEREKRCEYVGISKRNDLRQLIKSYIGAQISSVEFYDDEEDYAIGIMGKKDKLYLLDVDEKWVLFKLVTSKKETMKMIRISSIKSISKVDES